MNQTYLAINRSLLEIEIGSVASGADDTYYEAMRVRISASELGREFATVLHRVRSQGQSFLIEQDGEAVASLEPLEASRGVTWRTLKVALRDVPVEDADFAADLEEVQRNQPEIPASMWPT